MGKALLHSEPDRQRRALARKRGEREDADALTALLESMDKDGDGTVTFDELQLYHVLNGETDGRVPCRTSAGFYSVVWCSAR